MGAERRTPLEAAAEIEEVTQGQLPAGKEIGSEDLIARERGFHKILPALQPQDFDGLHLRINQPNLGHACLRVKGKFGGAVMRSGGLRKDFDCEVGRAGNEILLNYPDSLCGDEKQIGLKGGVWIQANIERRRIQYTEAGAPHIGSEVPGNIPKNQLVFSASGGRQVHFSVYQFEVLPVVGKLAELLVRQLGDNFGAHGYIIHLNQTLRSQRSSSSRHRKDGVLRESAGKRLSLAACGGRGRLGGRHEITIYNGRWTTPSPGPRRLVKAPVAVHPLPQGGEGTRDRNNAALSTQGGEGNRNRNNVPLSTQGERATEIETMLPSSP